MNDLIKIKIEDRIYSAQRFNPIDGLTFGLKAAALITPAIGGLIAIFKDSVNGEALSATESTEEMKQAAIEKAWEKLANGDDLEKIGVDLAKILKDPDLTPLMRQAFCQCFTPGNESLADEAVFSRHFIKFPGDMFVLGARAVWALAKDFFPSPLATIASGLPTKLQEMTTPPKSA